MNRKITGLAAISFIFAIAGIVISALLLKEDVTSTAHTIFEYFPSRYGVTPSSTWSGAIILGIFTSVLQVVAASVAFSNKFSGSTRGIAFLVLVSSVVFDNWTDVVFRSGNLTGDMRVAFATTLAFYTLGSEIAQGLSWLVFVGTWRVAFSDIMWGLAKFGAGWSSIGSEWSRFKRAAYNKEYNKEYTEKNDSDKNDRPNQNTKPVFPARLDVNHPKRHILTPWDVGNQQNQKKRDQNH